MKASVLFGVASRSILKNKMRTLLTMLGIIIGVAAVIVMVAVGEGAQSEIQSRIRNLGTNLIVITPGASSPSGVSQGAGSFNRITIADAEKLRREGTQIAAVSPVVFTRTQVVGGQGNWRTSINGVDTDYQTIRDWTVTSGSFFSAADVRSIRKVCVVGKTVADILFPDADPVGQQLQVRSVPFQIIGVLAKKGQTATGTDQDDVVLAPYTTVQSRLAVSSSGRSSRPRRRRTTSPRRRTNAARSCASPTVSRSGKTTTSRFATRRISRRRRRARRA